MSIARQIFIFSVSLFYGTTTSLKLLGKWLYYGNSFWTVKSRPHPPAILSDKSYGEHRYIQLKTIKLHYVENGDPSSPLMLCIHGFPEFWYSWRNQLKYFGNSYRVVAIDCRGYGDSEKPEGVQQYTAENVENDVVELISRLSPNKKCILVAHDLGGYTAWSIAAKNPNLIEKLIILNASHPTAYQIVVKSSLEQFLKTWYVFLYQLPFLPELSIYNNDLEFFKTLFHSHEGDAILNEQDMEAYKYTFRHKSCWTPPINYYRNSMTNTEAAMNLPRIKMPTLLIWGDYDIKLDNKIPVLAKNYVDQLRIEYIPNGCHYIQNQHPDLVNKFMDSFLSGK